MIGAGVANVQPNSGSQMNQIAFLIVDLSANQPQPTSFRTIAAASHIARSFPNAI